MDPNLDHWNCYDSNLSFLKEPGAVVIDHTSYAVSGTNGDHSIIATDDFIKSDVILGSQTIEGILILGIRRLSCPWEHRTCILHWLLQRLLSSQLVKRFHQWGFQLEFVL